jgi:hypothetical protein
MFLDGILFSLVLYVVWGIVCAMRRTRRALFLDDSIRVWRIACSRLAFSKRCQRQSMQRQT